MTSHGQRRWSAGGRGFLSPVWFVVAVLLCMLPDVGWAQAAQDEVPVASEPVTVRTPAPETLAPFRNDAAYNYDRLRTTGPSWWDRFTTWLWHVLTEPYAGPVGQTALDVLLYGLVVGILGFAVYWLTQTRASSAFASREAAPTSALGVTRSAIESNDFARAAQEAQAAGRYRDAVRYHYLHVLQELIRGDYVRWMADKTNRDYVRETSGTPVHDPFREVTDIFDRVWYGDEAVNADAYARIADRFQNAHHAVRAPSYES